MSDSFSTPAGRRLIFFMQLYCGILGLLLLILGVARISIEFIELASVLGGQSALLSALLSGRFLVLAGAMALVGYGALYATMALGAQEPPGLGAARSSLLAIALTLWALVLLLIPVNVLYAVALAIVAAWLSFLAYWLWQRAEQEQVWRIFGQRISRSSPRRRWIILGIVAAILLAALGVTYAVLTDSIELAPASPQAGTLLYATTFDNFNDEWDLPQSRQRADIVDGELVLVEGTGVEESGFYSLLEGRKFGDFDLRVRVAQVGGSPENSFGVVFRRRDPQNYYFFEISGDGYYRLTKIENGRAESITPSGWTPFEHIHLSDGSSANELRIVAKGEQFRFYINQQAVALCTPGDNREAMVNPLTGECITNEWQEIYRDNSFRQGGIGMAVGTVRGADLSEPLSVAFDNIVIVGPE